jgi:hypothetical protein
MPIASGVTGVVVAGSLLLALTGCGPGPVPHHSSHPGAHSTPHGSATATSGAATSPRSSLPLACADVLPLATAVGAFPASSGVSLQTSEASAPDGLFEVSAKQAGGLHCVWGGTQQQDGAPTDRITFDEIGAAAADYHDNVVPDTTETVNAFGTASASSCQGDPQFFCHAQVLVGPRWFELDYDSLGGEGEPSSGSTARFNTLVTGVTNRVQAAGADRTLWTPPSGWNGANLCEDAATARVRTVTGVTGMDFADASIEGPATAQTIALSRTGLQSCAWSNGAADPIGFSLQFVPGGAWAAAQELVHPPSHYDGTLAPVTIAGATSALGVCNDAYCRADMAVGAGWLSVQIDGLDSLAQLTHEVAALLAATPH